MQKCPKCGQMNRAGVIFCEKCGTNLQTGGKPLATKALEQSEKDDLAPVLEQKSTASANVPRGTDMFPKGGTLCLEVEGSSEPINFAFTQSKIILGRRDPATGTLPDIDLTPYAGYRMGVSRRHSQIRYENGHLDLFDQGSSNGTFLNGQRLEAYYPYRLHDGDRIGLGQIVMRVRFKQPATVEGEVPVVEEKTAVASPISKPPEVVKPIEPVVKAGDGKATEPQVQSVEKPAEPEVSKSVEPKASAEVKPISQPETVQLSEATTVEKPVLSTPLSTDAKPSEPPAAKSVEPESTKSSEEEPKED